MARKMAFWIMPLCVCPRQSRQYGVLADVGNNLRQATTVVYGMRHIRTYVLLRLLSAR